MLASFAQPNNALACPFLLGLSSSRPKIYELWRHAWKTTADSVIIRALRSTTFAIITDPNSIDVFRYDHFRLHRKCDELCIPVPWYVLFQMWRIVSFTSSIFSKWYFIIALYVQIWRRFACWGRKKAYLSSALPYFSRSLLAISDI